MGLWSLPDKSCPGRRQLDTGTCTTQRRNTIQEAQSTAGEPGGNLRSCLNLETQKPVHVSSPFQALLARSSCKGSTQRGIARARCDAKSLAFQPQFGIHRVRGRQHARTGDTGSPNFLHLCSNDLNVFPCDSPLLYPKPRTSLQHLLFLLFLLERNPSYVINGITGIVGH